MSKETVYVVTDRDMEELIFDTMLFTTYEKAMQYIQGTLEECEDCYDTVLQDDENSWMVQDDGAQPRIIELSSETVW